MVPALVLALTSLAGANVTTSAASANSANSADDDIDHDYRVSWPAGDPRGVVVFLHGVSLDPFAEEGEGIDALARAASERGLVAIFPIGRRVCDFEKPKEYQRCWLLDQLADEVDDLKKIIAAVEDKAGVTFKKRQLIGFSNGGFLVAGALQRGLLDGFTRVGILSAGPVGDVVPPPEKRLPHTFIEVGREDKWQRGSTRQLFSMLMSTTIYEHTLHYREVDGGHVFDGDRAASFLQWFWAGTG